MRVLLLARESVCSQFAEKATDRLIPHQLLSVTAAPDFVTASSTGRGELCGVETEGKALGNQCLNCWEKAWHHSNPSGTADLYFSLSPLFGRCDSFTHRRATNFGLFIYLFSSSSSRGFLVGRALHRLEELQLG